MKRLFTVLVAGTLMLGLMAVPAQAGWRQKQCTYQSLEPGHWTYRENHLTEECFAKKLGVSVATAHYVVDRESGHNEKAYNSYSGAAGLYQHLSRYWAGRVSAFDNLLDRYRVKNRSVWNPRANALVAMAMVRTSGWGAWTTV